MRRAGAIPASSRVHNDRVKLTPPRIALAALLLLLAAAAPCRALESDQYYAWGRELADATDVLNAKVRLEIDRALAAINAEPAGRRLSCHAVVRRVVPHFRKFIFQDIELWATNSTLVPRIPATPAEELEYRERFLYHRTHLFDVGTKVPPSPTIELNGVRLGTDKLSHFFSEGWMYYKWFRGYRQAGASVEEAEERAIRRGMAWERTILGFVSSGVFSLGDLEANYQGMRFLAGMCEATADGPPTLARDAHGWRFVGEFDFRDHVTPEWDESYQPPIFRRGRWNKVRPVLVGYCPQLHDESVRRRRLDYEARDRETPTERAVLARVEAGRLQDPRQFALESNCDLTAARESDGFAPGPAR